MLPTHVGMDRDSKETRGTSAMDAPHARGDGPGALMVRHRASDAPHARGDGPPVQGLLRDSATLPTHVGMDRVTEDANVPLI